MTTLVTSAVIGLCFLIRAHYNHVKRDLTRLDDILVPIAPAAGTREGWRSGPEAFRRRS